MKTLRKVISSVLTILMIISLFSLPASAETLYSGDYTYSLVSRNGKSYAYISDYQGDESSITLPTTLGGYSVGGIYKNAFKWNALVEEIIIPESVDFTTIQDNAFNNCVVLKKLVIPSTVTTVGYSIFNSSKQISDVTLYYSGGSYGDLPDFVTTLCLGKDANVSALSAYSKLQKIILDEENKSLMLVNGVLFNADETTLIKAPSGLNLTEYVIPEGVSVISPGAFSNNIKLTNITIPNTVEKILSKAFEQCQALESIDIPSSVMTYGSDVFYGCSSLTNAVLNIGPEDHGTTSFNGIAEYLTKIVFHEGAFFNADLYKKAASYIKEYEVDDDNTTLTAVDGVLYSRDLSVLYSYPGGREGTAYTVPQGTKEIGNYAFNSCNVTDLTVHYTVETIGYDALGTNVQTVYGYKDSAAESYATKKGIAFVDLGADCTHQNSTLLTVEPNCTEDGKKTKICKDCGKVLSVETLTALGHDWTNINYDWSADNRTVKASRTCLNDPNHYEEETANTYVKFSDSGEWNMVEFVAEFENEDFETQTITGKLDSKPFISKDGLWSYFFVGKNKISLYNDVNKSAYLADHNMGEGDSLTLDIPSEIDRYEVIAIGSYAFYNQKKFNYFNIPEGIKSIGSYSFAACTNLKKVTFPQNLVTVGDYAFYLDNSLVNCKLPATVTSVGEYAFRGCKSLNYAYIPRDLTLVSKGMYYDCTSLSNIQFKGQPTEIGEEAFLGCSGLYSVTVPSSVEAIGRRAFQDCTGLEELNLSEGIKDLGWQAFAGCTSLADVTIPSGMTSIGNRVFEDCSALTTLYFPKTLEVVNSSAFRNCTQLHEVFYEGSKEEWNETTIGANNLELQNAIVHYNVTGKHEYELVAEVYPSCTEPGYDLYRCPCGYEERYDYDPLGHNWGDVSYEWDDTLDFVTATRTCKRDSNHTESETVRTVLEETPATCTEQGIKYYYAEFENPDFDACEKVVVIDALGHDFGTPTYTWDEEKGTVTAIAVCNRNSSHIVAETVKFSVIAKTATCSEQGEVIYRAEFKNELFTTQEKTAYVDALGHDWDKPVYVWSSDNNSVTAVRVCKHDKTHIETETVTVSIITTAATCTEQGKVTYRAQFANSAFETQEKIAYSPALGHSWNEAEYVWSDDYSSVTATRVCKNDSSHIETETAKVLINKVSELDCTTDGITIYTARFRNPEFSTQTKTVTEKASGHDWMEPVYTWDEDAQTVTASCRCKNNKNHIIVETADIKTEITKQPSCTEPGVITKSAVFEDSMFEAQYRYVPIDATGHSFGEATYVWSDDCSSVTAERICLNDVSHKESETVATTSKIIKEATKEEEGIIVYYADFENEAFESVSLEKTLPKLPDDYKGFPDVKEGSWYYDAVKYNAERGFITGYQNGNFGPNNPITREDFVCILARIAGADIDGYTECKLTDVDMNAYYGKAVAWAVDNNIVSGYQNGKFGVGDKITREQVCTILFRYTHASEPENADEILKNFTDVAKVSSFAKNSVAWAVSNGVINGMADGRVAPTDSASRAQIAAIIMNMDLRGLLSD